MVIMKNTNNDKCWWECSEMWTFIHYCWECKLVQQIWKVVWRFLKNWKYNCYMIPWSHSWVYTQRNVSRIQYRYLQSHVYSSTVQITKLWKQPRCPTTDECINITFCI
jgi:hypothetical protein